MCPGAKGSTANLCSMSPSKINKGGERHNESSVTGALQATLLPRSSPSRRVKTAHIKTIAPTKSTRLSFDFQSELSILGNLNMRTTAMNATAQRGACARKALVSISKFHMVSACEVSHHRQPIESANMPPIRLSLRRVLRDRIECFTKRCTAASPKCKDDVQYALPGASFS